MADEQFDLRQSVARLSISRFKNYLIARGWGEKPSRYVDHIYFQLTTDDPNQPYELYLPQSKAVANHHTRLMRAIYKLCGIEDREPQDIVQDMFNCAADQEPVSDVVASCVRFRNTGSAPLQLQIDEPRREHLLLPGEAIELSCAFTSAGTMKIDVAAAPTENLDARRV